MKLDDEGLDRVRLFGQPYHGLWKAGSIALLNGTQKPCPAPIGAGQGFCVPFSSAMLPAFHSP